MVTFRLQAGQDKDKVIVEVRILVQLFQFLSGQSKKCIRNLMLHQSLHILKENTYTNYLE